MLKELPAIFTGISVVLLFGAALTGGQIENSADITAHVSTPAPVESIRTESLERISSTEIALNQTIHRLP